MKIHRRVVGPLATNCYILEDEASGKAVVIDPGAKGPSIVKHINKLGLTLEGIILTHGHIDHIFDAGVVQQSTGAVVYLAEGDKKFLSDPDWMKPLMDTEDMVVVEDYSIVKEGDVIAFGNSNLHVLETPGHSPGSISLYWSGEQEPGILFSGDLIFELSVGRTDFPGGNTSQLLASIRDKVFTLPDDTLIYPGHDVPTTVGKERTENPFLS